MGLQSGYGRYDWLNGNSYEGDFKEGKKNGKGKFKWDDSSYYNGSWLEDTMEG